MKKLFFLLCFIILLFLDGCFLETSAKQEIKDTLAKENAFEKWKNSEEALDLNDDKKINYEDYEIYLSYIDWKNSEEALDLNSDRKINYDDYKIFLEPNKNDFELWWASSKAYDYNKDGNIDEDDYNYYLQYGEFVGQWVIKDFTYNGYNYKLFKSKLTLANFSDITSSIVFDFSNENVSINSINDVKDQYEIDENNVYNLLSTMKITRLSKYVVEIEFNEIANNIPITYTFYLTDNGNNEFISTSALKIENATTNIQFSLVRYDENK